VAIPVLVGLAFLWNVILPMVEVGFHPLMPLLALAGALFVWDQRRLGGLKMWRRTRLRLPARMRFRAGRAARTCCLCLDALAGEETSCPGCGAVAHDGCRVEFGRCGTLGCEQVTPRAAEAKAKA
jgi:hypothetical protein